ncbi:MAG TPA: tRNA uridine-5-carboxymethylaminomethyl(34) synthesis GTPase MnmE [Rhodanobacteraceae bacterium]|nr:tRNA uridine-5-carboxymethylaminomethyl(34) synthesis GTPase MnmE [Rhodanobacteraceae bacterium]
MSAADSDTIAAIATAPGAAGVGVVRVSGARADTIARTLLGREPWPRHAHFAHIHDAAGEVIDHGLLLYFPAPHSYTGEHVLELQLHGSAVVLDQVLRRVCALGARLARPGEFSERAFLNGKLDLAQAEAVADLIAARSESAARAALRSLQGRFSRRVEALLDALTLLRVHIEAAIDFPEEEIDFLADPVIGTRLETLQRDLDTLLGEARRGLRLADGLSVVIVGRPNVGKSSLLNALAGDERAIVTAVAGTTRDALREMLDIDGVSLELIDTAGLRETGDEVEREGVRRARAHLERADLALLVTEAGQADEDMALLADLPATTPRLVIINKIDLDDGEAQIETRDGIDWLWLSAHTGAGLDLLRTRLKHLAGADEQSAGGAFSARRRHVLALERTAAHLDAADHMLHDTRAGELAAEELHQAQQALGEITGAFYPDDLLGAIFSSFCIGK